MLSTRMSWLGRTWGVLPGIAGGATPAARTDHSEFRPPAGPHPVDQTRPRFRLETCGHDRLDRRPPARELARHQTVIPRAAAVTHSWTLATARTVGGAVRTIGGGLSDMQATLISRSSQVIEICTGSLLQLRVRLL